MTGLRLLGIVATCAGLFALTWYFVRDKPQEQPPPKVKTAEELLVGTWEFVESDPPMSSNLTSATTDFTKDGKSILRANHFKLGPLPSITGVYQLQGETIRFDYPEDADNPHQMWTARIETITDETLILTSEGLTKRAVYKRVSRN